ncbi:MAG: NAD(P)H:quinone oxidoreductase [bacterium]
MKNILILYYSRHGSVAALAREVAAGVEGVDRCAAMLRTVPAVSSVSASVAPEIPDEGDVYCELAEVESCDGLILGSPTRFGATAAPLKHFFEQTTSLWLSGALDGKPAGVFTSSGSMHGGQESTLLAMMPPLLHHGMVLVGLPFYRTALGRTETGGTPYGASHVAGTDNRRALSTDEKDLAQTLGARVARCALALSAESVTTSR